MSTCLFAEIFSVNSTLNLPANLKLLTVPEVPQRLRNIEIKQVCNYLLKVNTNKTSGPDEISALLLNKSTPKQES